MADKIIHPARKRLADHLDQLRGIPALIFVPAVLLGLSWLAGEMLYLIFPRGDPDLKIPAGFGFLMILGLGIMCALGWSKERR